MKTLKCPICENTIEIAADLKAGSRLTCPNCFAQLGLHGHGNGLYLACPICKESVFDPANCELCERRQDKRALLEEGRL